MECARQKVLARELEESRTYAVLSKTRLCATNATITDEFAPYYWTNTACQAWTDALFAEANAAGQTDEVMTLGAPVVVSVKGDAAYMSVPGHLTFKAKGKPRSENGMFAAVMTKMAGEWKIASWAWATTKR